MFPSTKAFRILYNTLYYALYLILLGVLIVSPADLMRQAVMHRNNTNVLIIAASYLVTILVLLVIYFGRLYINRSVLASIPKGWIPVDKSDGVPKKVREVIVTELSRSAAIAWGARPRVELVDTAGGSRTGTAAAAAAGTGSRGTAATHADGAAVAKEKKNTKGLAVAADSEQNKRPHHRIISTLRSGSCTGGGSAATMTEKDSDMATAAAVASVGVIPPKDAASPPVWGEIEHPGWASPTSPDLPNLQYNAVISELPNLIEAKALTLAPLDPASSTDPPALDPDAVAVLQRPETMGLREYLLQLTEMEVLAPVVVGPFIAQYEAARFSTRPVSNHQFRQLMHLFAELLRAMQPLDPAVLLEEYDEDDEEDGDYASAIYDTDIDNDAPRESSSSSLSLSVQEEGGGHNLQNKNDNNHHLNDNFNNNTNNLQQITRQKSSSSSADSMSSQRRYSIASRTSNLAGGGLPPSGRNTPLSMVLRNSSANSTWQQQHSQSHSLSQTFRTAPTTPKSRRTITGTFEDDDGRSSRSFSSVRTGSGGGSTGIIGANKKKKKKKKKKNSMAANSSPELLVSGGTTTTNRKSTSTTSGGTRNDGIGKDIEMDDDNFAQTRHPYIPGGSSSGSVRSANSGASRTSSNGSGRSGGGSVVIRLASGQEESSSGLPYILGGRIGLDNLAR
ncbi:hypothetical protein QBC37DRAFT_433200 [Rhypophila decipiens]|uniref:Defect at low temperature protein 1 n=1 Tax=Rhypophila decipiens TaxID=261697 RepID=A0AAN6XVD4_9PEZI|nr:hypothetical protein QBC37DRAFT_433200 [Rhypophila decipiens]